MQKWRGKPGSIYLTAFIKALNLIDQYVIHIYMCTCDIAITTPWINPNTILINPNPTNKIRALKRAVASKAVLVRNVTTQSEWVTDSSAWPSAVMQSRFSLLWFRHSVQYSHAAKWVWWWYKGDAWTMCSYIRCDCQLLKLHNYALIFSSHKNDAASP